MDVVLKFFGFAAVVLTLSFLFIHQEIILTIIVVLVSVLAIFVINFFRDPERTTPNQSNIVVSPADGKIVLINQVFEPEFLKDDAIQVSVFMSPLNVHVNRFPISGIIKFFRYIEGDYIVAFEDKSSEVNERTHIGIEHDGYKVLFKQIAGAVARRIVAPIAVGQQADIGKRFGMIKFGSRVDVIMPKNSHVIVKVGQIARAGETILATFANNGERV